MVKKTNKNKRNKRRETRKKTNGLKNMSNTNTNSNSNSNSNSNNSNYNIKNIRGRNAVIPPHLRRPNNKEIQNLIRLLLHHL